MGRSQTLSVDDSDRGIKQYIQIERCMGKSFRVFELGQKLPTPVYRATLHCKVKTL